MLTILSTRRDGDDVEEIVGEARAASDHLLGIVNDILDLSKLDEGKTVIALAPVEPREVARSILSIFRAQAKLKGVDVSLEVDPSVGRHLDLDAGRLSQVLANLVGNAIKFTDRGGIRVRIARGEREGRAVLRIDVEDDGPGIEPADRDRLFEPYEQVAGTPGAAGKGTGLGLPISRGLAELMGGAVWVEGGRRGGSVFRLELPYVAAAAPGGSRSVAQVPRTSGLALLVVDDNRTNRMVAKLYAERLGHSADTADGGRAALGMAGAGGYDAILMDIQMPGMDGLAAMRTMRERGTALAAVPIVAMTANADPEEVATYLDAGFDAYLAKPMTLESFARVLNALPIAPGHLAAAE